MSDLSESERLDRLRLIRSSNIGPATFRVLLRRFGSATRALAEIPSLSHRAGGRRVRLYSKSLVKAEMDKLHHLGGKFVMIGDEDYPETLASLDHAPPVLSVMGHSHLIKKTCIAIVGTRHASASALSLTKKIAAEIAAENHIIVSGMALGIDTMAHEASLTTGTIAVLAGGVNVVYPPQNQGLYEQICATGCVISEMKLDEKPRAQHFPRRNRIISGLSLASVIVEAPTRSGAMITARMAAEQGRLVCAVPGSPMDPRAKGTNRLLRDGATLVETGEDVLREIAPLLDRPLKEDRNLYMDDALPVLPDPQQDDYDRIISLLGPTAVGLDDIVRLSGLSASLVNVIVTDLELAGRVHRDLGGRVAISLEGEEAI